MMASHAKPVAAASRSKPAARCRCMQDTISANAIPKQIVSFTGRRKCCPIGMYASPMLMASNASNPSNANAGVRAVCFRISRFMVDRSRGIFGSSFRSRPHLARAESGTQRLFERKQSHWVPGSIRKQRGWPRNDEKGKIDREWVIHLAYRPIKYINGNRKIHTRSEEHTPELQ